MSQAISTRPKSYRIAWIVLVISLTVAGYAAWQASAELSSDDCISVTSTLTNGSKQTVRTCS